MLKSISVAPLVSNVWKIFWELWKKRVAVGKSVTQCQSAIKKRSIDKIKCATEDIRSRSYKLRTSHPEVNVTSLNDDDSYNEEEIIFENGNKEGYLFSSDSE